MKLFLPYGVAAHAAEAMAIALAQAQDEAGRACPVLLTDQVEAMTAILDAAARLVRERHPGATVEITGNSAWLMTEDGLQEIV